MTGYTRLSAFHNWQFCALAWRQKCNQGVITWICDRVPLLNSSLQLVLPFVPQGCRFEDLLDLHGADVELVGVRLDLDDRIRFHYSTKEWWCIVLTCFGITLPSHKYTWLRLGCTFLRSSTSNFEVRMNLLFCCLCLFDTISPTPRDVAVARNLTADGPQQSSNKIAQILK